MLAKLKTADILLIIADIQDGIVNLPLTVPEHELRNTAQGLARLAELYDIPTFAMMIPKQWNAAPKLIDEICQARTTIRAFGRTSPDSFDNVEFADAVAATGRRTLIICGVATEVVLQRLVLGGLAKGYAVQYVVDACAGLSHRSEQAAWRRMEGAGAVPTSVFALVGELVDDFTANPGKAAVEVVYHMLQHRDASLSVPR